MGIEQVGLQHDRLATGRRRFVQAAQGQQRGAEVAVGLGVVRLQLDRAAVGGLRLVEAVKAGQRVGHVEVGGRMARREGQRLLLGLQGRLEPALQLMHAAQHRPAQRMLRMRAGHGHGHALGVVQAPLALGRQQGVDGRRIGDRRGTGGRPGGQAGGQAVDHGAL